MPDSFVLFLNRDMTLIVLASILPADLFVTVHLTVTQDNAGNSSDTLERLARLHVKNLSFGAAEDSLHETLHALHNRAANLGITLRWDLPVPYSEANPVSLETKEDKVSPGAGEAWMYVEPDGDVLPAQGLADQVLGNFLRDPWEQIRKK